jgi:hypothetical protein
LPDNLSLDAIRTHLISILKLSYTPNDWQVHLIQQILQGYDSIFCAGMGYGKSLIFKALAVLGGSKKLIIVISLLKALERDQVFKLAFQVITMLNFCFRQNMQLRRELMLLLLMKTHPRLLSFGNELAQRLRSLICLPRWRCLRASRNYGELCDADLEEDEEGKDEMSGLSGNMIYYRYVIR